MTITKSQTDQIVNEDALVELGSQARDNLRVTFDRLNKESRSPLKLSATFPIPDSKLNFAASAVLTGDGAYKTVAPLKSQIPTIVASTVDFQTQATTGATFLITWPTSNAVGTFRRVGFTLLPSGLIQALFSAEALFIGALANPGTLFVKSGIALGYINLECTDNATIIKFKTPSSTTEIIENSNIFRFGSGAGGSSASGSSAGGGELSDLMFNAMIRDDFANGLDGTTPTDIGSDKTDSTIFDSANELVRLSYDASKTVTGVGTSMTLNSAPSFTIKNGDVIICNGEVRKFTVTSQTTIILESVFSSDPSGLACCVSQALHTVDLNNFDNGGLGQSVASQYTTNIDEVMLGYADTETLGDIIPNFGSAPVVAFSASTDLSSWTTPRIRATSLSDQESVATCPTSNPNLYLRFFANKTSGSGAVNLLSYKVAFHKIIGQVAGATYYTAFARPTSSIAQNCTIGLVGGKTRFTFDFPYTRGVNADEPSASILEVIANGQIVPRHSAGITDNNQAYFIEVNDNTIEMDTDYSNAGIDFQFKVQRIGIIDNNSQNTSKIALHDDLLDQSLDAQVIPLFRTAINGAPSSTQFRSDITNRASIPDLSSMLSVQMGPQRMMTQEIYQLQTEFGPAGQQVFGVVNDKFNQIRFVGSWTNFNDNNGQAIANSTSTTDYIEVVFYGTGLTLLGNKPTGGKDFRVSVDGGSEGSNIITATSSIFDGRNYSANIIFPIVSGLSLGFHTVKIRNNAAVANFYVHGFEVLTETTSLRVMPGTVMKGRYKNSLSALQTVAYDSNFESGTLGTKGGCVLVYLKNDGTIGKSVTPTDATALYLASTNHANEEVVRTHHFREFGCGRSDDFSLLVASPSSRAFTLDDGITTLVGLNAAVPVASGGGVSPSGTNDFLTFTFVGTGLDVYSTVIANATSQIFVDGVSIAASGLYFNTVGFWKICSGLPYGTHTVKVINTSSATSPAFSQFIVYAPKKPSLPVGSIEQAQYYKMADYVGSSSATLNFTPSGTIRKSISVREAIYTGTWSISGSLDAVNFENAVSNSSSVSGNTVSYSFFGTGFEWRSLGPNGAVNNATLQVDGSSNISLFTTSFLQSATGAVFTPTTGVLSGTNSANNKIRLQVSGLTLGWHTIKWTMNSTAIFQSDAFDIITPIHAPTINGPYVVQNTLSLGNNNFLDLRKFNKRDIILSNQSNTSQASGFTSFSTSSTSPVPVADLSLSHNSKTGKIRIVYALSSANSGGNYDQFFRIYIDGKSIGTTRAHNQQNPGLVNNVNDCFLVNISAGVHKIDVYGWTSGGTLSVNNINKHLIAEDV